MEAEEKKVETTEQERASAVESAQVPEVSGVEADIAVQALQAESEAAAPGPAPAGTVPVGVVHGLRGKVQERDTYIDELRQTVNNLQATIEDRQKPAETPSPLEQYSTENPDTPFGDVPAEVHVAQDKWKGEQAAKSSQVNEEARRLQVANQAVATAKLTITDYDDVVAMGRRHMSKGNMVDVADSDNPAITLYKLAIKATLESDTADAEVLRKHLQAKAAKQVAPQSLPKTEQEAEQETPGQTPVVETEGEMSPRLAQAYGMLGL